MYRIITQQLKTWKLSKNRKPLILLGARQVGKTWVMQDFGKNNYENVAYINCDEEPLAKSMFEADYNISRILLVVQAITGVTVKPDKTLIRDCRLIQRIQYLLTRVCLQRLPSSTIFRSFVVN